MSAKGFYIKGFDGLRAISILMVLCTHLGLYDSWELTGWQFGLSNSISGAAGVNVFFTISGFLITTLLLNEKKRTGTIGYKNFIIRRFLRLLPTLLLFYAVILFLIITGSLDIKISALLISFCYAYNFVPNRLYYSELGHTWSLAVEEQFYVFWPWVLYFFRKNGLLVIAATLFFLALVAIYFVPNIRVEFHGRAYFIGESFHADRFFLPAIAPIMIGSAFAVFNFFNAVQVQNIISKTPIKIVFILLIFSAFLIPIGLINYSFVFQALGYGSLLLYIAHHQSAIITGIFEWKPLAFIGKISYGIYVWQGLFLGTGPGGKLWIQQPVINIVLTFLVATISFYFIEKKVLQLKSKFQS